MDWPDDSPSPSSSSSSSTVFVRNLPYEWTDVDLTSAFESVGPLRRAFVVTTRKGARESRGFGFVEYALPDDALKAVDDMDGKEERGRKLKVELAVQRKDKAAGVKRKDGSRDVRTAAKRVKAEAVKEESKEEDAVMSLTAADIDSETSEESSDDGDDSLHPPPARWPHPSAVTDSADEDSRDGDEDADEEGEDEEEEDEITFNTTDASSSSSLVERSPPPKSAVPRSPPPSSSSSRTLLLSGLPPSTTSLTSLLSTHSLHPSLVVFPAPESTPKYKAARLTFLTAPLAASALSSLALPPLRCVLLPAQASRLIVRNLPFHITSEHLRKVAAAYGSVVEARVVEGARPGLSRGFGFVLMGSMEEGERMVRELSGTKLWGRTMAVDWSLDKADYHARIDMAKRAQPAATVKEEEEPSDDAAVKEEKDAEPLADDERSEDEEDDAEEEVEKEEEETKAATPKPPAKAAQSPDTDDACTLFIRNLSYDTTEAALYDRFALFGRVKYAKIVVERIAGVGEEGAEAGEEDGAVRRSKGVAFVRYYRKEDADRVLTMCQPSPTAFPSTSARPTLLSSLSDTGITLDGRQLSVVLAVSRHAAGLLTAKAPPTDKRNLYLAREGVILSSSEAADGLTAEEVKRRERYYREKKKKLDNPNFLVSRVRLSVRNLPLELEEKALKRIFVGAVREAMREERRQEREGRKKEEEEESAAIALGQPIDEERRRRRREGRETREAQRQTPILVRQVKVVRDKERPGAGGLGRSKRYGFIEFSEHEHALRALRAVNNRKEVWGPGVSGGRPIVEFAVDDVRKLKERGERQMRWDKLRELRARQLAEKERAEQGGGAGEEEKGEGEGQAKTQRERKREAREKGVCYKCGEAGHQAKKCRKKHAVDAALKEETPKAPASSPHPRPPPSAAAKPSQSLKPKADAPSAIKEEQPAARANKAKRKAVAQAPEAPEAKVPKTAKPATPSASSVGSRPPVVTAKKKRARDDDEGAGLSKRDKRELESEAKFESLVARYKRTFFEAAGGAEEGEGGRRKITSRWFDV